MKILKTLPIVLLSMLFFSCQEDSVDIELSEERNDASELLTDDEVWQKMDKVQEQIEKELSSISLPDIPPAKIPNPFVPKLITGADPWGDMGLVRRRAYVDIPTSDYFYEPDLDWSSNDSPARRIQGFTGTSSHWEGPDGYYYMLDLYAENSGPKGFIEFDMWPSRFSSPLNGDCPSSRYYRITIRRKDGENWTTVKDYQNVAEPYWYSIPLNSGGPKNHVSINPSLYIEYENQLDYEITDNEQRNKWYHIAVSGYADCPGEPSEPRVMNAVYYFEKFDPGFTP